MLSKNLLLFILFLCFITGCKDKDIISVPLDLETGNLPAFDPIYMDFPFLFLHEDYGKYYEHQTSTYKNVPKGVILYLATSFMDYRKFVYDLNQSNLIDSLQYQLVSERLNLDSTAESKKLHSSQIVIATGLIDGKQFVVTDTNGNMDFGDEEVVFFDFNFINNSEKGQSILEKGPLINYTFHFYVEDTLETYQRRIKIFPKADNYAFQRVTDTIAKKLGAIGRFQEYWKGHTTVDGIGYDVAIQGFNSARMEILIKENSLAFSDSDVLYNANFRYQINDTLRLSNNMYQIVRVDKPINHLYLKKVDAVSVHPSGYRMAETIKDYNLIGIDGETFSLYKSHTKKYTLIDFWGTWCLPCRELTPSLKELHKEYGKNLDILSIASDQSPEIVKEYTLKNQMDWKQAFLDMKKENQILKSLKIAGYPTLILIDADHKIVYRGGTLGSLNKIREIIKKN